MTWLIILPLLFSGCGQVSQTATTDIDSISTIVAETLTAVPLMTSDIEAVSPTDTLEVVSQNPTSTPSLTLSVTPTVTPSVTPSATPTDEPTHTLTSVPTEDYTPTPASDDPVDSLGSPEWRASFKDSAYWYTFEDEQASIQVKNGALVLKSFKANSYESWSMSYPKISDFYLEIQGTAGDACKGKDRYGIIFRAPDPNEGYLFGISCDGYYRVRTWDGEEFTELVGWQQSEHILRGPSQTNRIGVLADGIDLSFYINGHLVEEIQDNTYNKGVFGAYIAAAETQGFTISIIQAAYWDLNDL
jgi:hypothetical protein